jgi:hypothetical protein
MVLDTGAPPESRRELKVLQGNIGEHLWPISSRAWHLLAACAAASQLCPPERVAHPCVLAPSRL